MGGMVSKVSYSRLSLMIIASAYQIQVADSINMLVGHLRWNDTTGRLIKINLQQLQIELGSVVNALQLDYHRWKNITTDSWVATVWRHLSENDMTITVEEAWIPKSLKVGEKGIMDHLIDEFSGQELKDINAVRLYLQVIYPSDVLGAAGNRIKPNILQGRRDNINARYNFPFPKQREPTQEWKTTWAKAMATLLQKVDQSKVHWAQESRTGRSWIWWISRDRTKLFCKVQDQWEQFLERMYENKFRRKSTSVETCGDAIRCDVRVSVATISVISVSKTGEEPSVIPATRTIRDHLSQLHPSIRRVMGRIRGRPEHIRRCCIAAQLGRMVAGSDGSVLNGRGSHGWLICHEEDISCQVRGHGPVDGVNVTSYTSELWGILGVMSTMEVLASHQDIRGWGRLYVDNNSAVSQALREDSALFSVGDATRDEVEILTEISKIMDRSRIRWTISWVKSLQKDLNTIESKVNNAADKLADQAHNMEGKWGRLNPTPSMPSIGYSVRTAQGAIHTKLRNGLYSHLQDRVSLKYLQDKEDWTKDDMDAIDWEALRRSLKGKTFGARLTRVKIQHEWLATNQYQKD